MGGGGGGGGGTIESSSGSIRREVRLLRLSQSHIPIRVRDFLDIFLIRPFLSLSCYTCFGDLVCLLPTFV